MNLVMAFVAGLFAGASIGLVVFALLASASDQEPNVPTYRDHEDRIVMAHWPVRRIK